MTLLFGYLFGFLSGYFVWLYVDTWEWLETQERQHIRKIWRP